MTEIIEKDSTNAAAYVNRGVGYANLGENKLAIKDYNSAISLDPKMYQSLSRWFQKSKSIVLTNRNFVFL